MNLFVLTSIFAFCFAGIACEAKPDRQEGHDITPSESSYTILLLSNVDESNRLSDTVARTRSIIHTLDGHPRWINDWRIFWDDGEHADIAQIAASDSSCWSFIEVGRSWRRNNHGHTGVGWYKRSFQWGGDTLVTPAFVSRAMEDSITVYLNGTLVYDGGGNWADIEVDLSAARIGENTLYIRVVNSAATGDPGRGGLSGYSDLSVILRSSHLQKSYDMIVLSSPLLMSWYSAHSLREYARHGGTIVAIFHDSGELWRHLPLEEILPTHLGYPGEYVRRLVPVIDADWLKSYSNAPSPIDVRPAMNLPGHPRFHRPGTQNMEWWRPSALAWDYEVLIRGNDGCETPILSRCEYGSGHVYACYSPELLTSTGADAIWSHMLSTTHPSSNSMTPPLAKIWSTGSVPWKKLQLMGCEYAERRNADLVIIAEATPHSLSCLDSALTDGQQILVLDQEVFTQRPGIDPWYPEKQLFPAQTEIARYIHDPINAQTVSVPVPDAYNGYTVFLEHERYGPVRGAWFDQPAYPCVDGSWTLSAPSRDSKNLHLGIWPNTDKNPGIIHWGNYGILTTTSGVSLRQAVPRPFQRKPRDNVLWNWEDGIPAVASMSHGSSRVIAPAVDLHSVNPRNFSWNDMAGSKKFYLNEDTEILSALLAREIAAGPMLIPSCSGTTGETWSVTVPMKGCVQDTVVVRIRLMDWQRNPIYSREFMIATRQKNSHTISLPWPEYSPEHTGIPRGMEAFYWAEVMVLGTMKDRCLGWIEQSIRRPITRFHIWHTPVQRRSPPHVQATWPRFHEEGFPTGWGPASQYPLFSPGDSIDFFVETYAVEQDIKPVITIHEFDTGTSRQLKPIPKRHDVRPWKIHTYPTFIAESPGIIHIEARADTYHTRQRIFVSNSSRGMRNVIWDRHKGVQVLGSLYPHVDGSLFTQENGVGDANRSIPWGMFRDTWPGQPWCNFHPNPHSLLPNGLHYRNYIASTIRDLSTHVWTGELMTISASLVDGFNGVIWPAAAVHPQHLMVFADWMYDSYGYEIPDMTVDSLAAFVQDELDPYWRRFTAEELSLRGHEIFRTELQKASPQSQVTDQCDLPQLPTLLRIPDVETFAQRWQRVFDISSMDAWNVRAGRTFRSATYLGCLGKALAPTMKFGHFHMEMLGGDGPERISTLPRMYRQNADLMWMSVADTAGNWIPVLDYPNGGGVSWFGGWEHWLGVCSRGIRGGHTAFPEDYGGLMRLFALGEVIRPEFPRGFVLAAVGPRTAGIGKEPIILGDQARLFSLLREGGLPISALARLDFLRRDNLPDGLILPIPGALSDKEKNILSWMVKENKPVGIVACNLSNTEICRYTGLSASDLRKPVITILESGNLRGPFWDDGTAENHHDIASFIESCIEPAVFSIPAQPGLSTYAFTNTDELVIIVEDNLGMSRDISIPVRTSFRGHHAEEMILDSSVDMRTMDDGIILETTIPASAALLIRITGN